jgi:hypothetical protein
MHHGVFSNNSRKQSCDMNLRADLSVRLNMYVNKLTAYLYELKKSMYSNTHQKNKYFGLTQLLGSLSEKSYVDAETIALELLGRQTTQHIPNYLKPSIKYRQYIPWGKSRAETLADEAFEILNDINSVNDINFVGSH